MPFNYKPVTFVERSTCVMALDLGLGLQVLILLTDITMSTALRSSLFLSLCAKLDICLSIGSCWREVTRMNAMIQDEVELAVECLKQGLGFRV